MYTVKDVRTFLEKFDDNLPVVLEGNKGNYRAFMIHDLIGIGFYDEESLLDVCSIHHYCEGDYAEPIKCVIIGLGK